MKGVTEVAVRAQFVLCTVLSTVILDGSLSRIPEESQPPNLMDDELLLRSLMYKDAML